MQAQRQALCPRAQGKVGLSPLLSGLPQWPEFHPGVLWAGPHCPGPSGPGCSALTLHLPPAAEDALAQLLRVLRDLQEAHRSSPTGSPPSEPNRLLALQT